MKMISRLHEFTATGLALWRLRRASDEQLWCSAYYLGSNELVLVVQDQATEQPVVEDTYVSIAPLIECADRLRHQFEAQGWQEVDVDLDEPD